jgi:hypothetical protein
VQLPGDFSVAQASRAVQHNPSAHGHGLGSLWLASHTVQLLAIFVGDLQSFLGATGAHTQVCTDELIYSTYFSLRTLELRKRIRSKYSGKMPFGCRAESDPLLWSCCAERK